MNTEEQARELVEQLGVIQVEGRALGLPCPRCGEKRMNPIAVRNSLSRYAKVYICDVCGMDEAMRDMTGQPQIPLSLWGMAKAFDADNTERGENHESV